MFNRENAIGIVLLGLCATVAVALLVSITTGNRFRLDGPAWLGPALAILFTAAAIWGFFTRPGRRWPWDRD
jgi:hypothetical protein